jgi:uncharacterized membrane protein
MNPVRPKTEDFFNGLDRAAIVEAIRAAEAKGRGEIRVHLHHGRVADARALAEKTFQRLGMDKTELRSGCLLFIAPEERAFAVIGDTGIHQRVGPTFWLDARDAAGSLFSSGKFTEGIVAAVEKLGEALARHFPVGKGAANPNELADEVTVD